MRANNLADIRKYEAKRLALHIAIVFLTAVIAVIAAVNMINIISTGILNRKSELASMQSIGMTDGLYTPPHQPHLHGHLAAYARSSRT